MTPITNECACRPVTVNFYKALGRHRSEGEKDQSLANRIGIPIATLGNWKLGRQPSLIHVVHVANALGVKPGKLLEAAIEEGRGNESNSANV
ncbi:MAG: helix-turn-helix domain-containing protein [Desulfomonilaceae bacterium]